jgi:tetratricopeptide (TPR) repeat protein
MGVMAPADRPSGPDLARARFKEAIALMPDADRDSCAEMYTRLGHALRLGGDPEALHCYELAARLSPTHVSALRGMIELFAAHAQWRKVAGLEEQLFTALDDDAQRCVELVASGDRWLKDADAPARARVRYGRALHANPDSNAARRRLASLADVADVANVTPEAPATDSRPKSR